MVSLAARWRADAVQWLEHSKNALREKAGYADAYRERAVVLKMCAEELEREGSEANITTQPTK